MSRESNRRVLIVDDDESIRLVLGRIVRKAGYLVGYVRNAREAIAEIGAAVPDIIFTDIRMPDTDGFALINWLRRSNSKVPLVAMSGANTMLTGQLGLATKLGARATIAKPILEQDVLEAIRSALGVPVPAWPSRRGA